MYKKVNTFPNTHFYKNLYFSDITWIINCKERN